MEHAKLSLITSGCMISELFLGGVLMENLKMEKQRTQLPYRTILNQFTSRGISGIYSGLLPWGVILAASKGLIYGASFSLINKKINNPEVSALSAGFLQGVGMTPLMLFRNIANESKTNSVKFIFSEGKSRGLLQGCLGTSLRQSANWGIRIYLNEKITNPSDHTIVKLGKAFFSGAIVSVLTIPIDSIVPIAQSKIAKEKGIIPVLKDVYSKTGMKMFTSGLGMRTVYVCWHTMWVIGGVNYIKDKF